MSATGIARKDGSRTVRAENDFYATPEWVTSPIAEYLIKAGHTMACTFVDPFAGDGAILRVLRKYTPLVHGYEIDQSRVDACRSEGLDVEQRDSMVFPPYLGARDVIVTNPPFSIAEQWVRKVLIHRPFLPSPPVLAVLLRLAFLESKSRAALHKMYPAHVMVLSDRPSFTGKGTDSAAYAWFVWGDGREGMWSVFDGRKPAKAKKTDGAQ